MLFFSTSNTLPLSTLETLLKARNFLFYFGRMLWWELPPTTPPSKKDSTATTTIGNKSRATNSCHILCYFSLGTLTSVVIKRNIFFWQQTFGFSPSLLLYLYLFGVLFLSFPDCVAYATHIPFHFADCLFELAQKDHYAKDIVRPWINWPMSMGKSYARKYVESPQQWHFICISIFFPWLLGNTFNILPPRGGRGEANLIACNKF